MKKAIYDTQKFDLTFQSGETYCAAWLVLPKGVKNPPVVILGHGFGAIREMRLDAFSEKFAQAGVAALSFTYRYFGDSGGTPRQLMSIERQLEDWDAAIRFAKNCGEVDGKRIAVWGSSFGGGHALTVASRHPELLAAVSQCPFTDGRASAGALGVVGTLKMVPFVIADLIAKVLGTQPVYVPIAAQPGELAMMNAPDALPGYLNLVPKGVSFVNQVTARVVPEVTAYRPGLNAAKIKAPLLVCVSATDSVTPPEKTIAMVGKAPRVKTKVYNAGHFDFYTGDTFEQLAKDQSAFLVEHLVTPF